MNLVTVLIGIVILSYGIYTAIIRGKNPSKLGKLEAMKKHFGEKTGKVIHVIAYTVAPIVIGITIAVCVFIGVSFFG